MCPNHWGYSLCRVIGNVGLTISRHCTELFYILDFSDHCLETITYSVLQKHPRQGSLPCFVLDGEAFQRWLPLWTLKRGIMSCDTADQWAKLWRGTGGGFWGLRVPLQRLSAPRALSFESLLCIWYSGFQKATHQICDRVVNQTTSSCLKIHLATLTPLAGVLLVFPLCLKKFFLNLLLKAKKDSWDVFPCFCKMLKLEALIVVQDI